MKTIAFFSGYSLPHLGGIERYTDNLSKQLIKKGYRVIDVSSDYQFLNKNIIEEDNKLKLTIPVRKLFVGRYPIPKKNKIYREVIKRLDKEKIDAIIVNTRFHLTSLVGAKYGKKHGIPVYLIEHGSQHLTVNNKVLDFLGAIYEHWLTKIVKKYVNYYYGVSYGACEWQKHFKIKSDGVWYNSINNFSNELKITRSDSSIHIFYAGRILKQKGLDRLLDSFCELEKKYSNIKLTIAGDGDQLEYLKSKYKSKKIDFLGKVDFEKLKELYSNANIFVYAPIWPEGLPTSILEAGLSGCVVIGSPQGGIKEIIEDRKNGLMINTKDELVETLEKLINDNKLREKYSKNINKTIREKFLWENTAKKIIDDIEKNR